MGQELADLNGMPRECCEPTSISNEIPRQVYSKDFLLSVADLEYCSKLPPGIDPVVLRDAPFDLVDGGITIQALSSRGLIRRDKESDGPADGLTDVPEWRRPSNVSGSSLLQQAPRRSELPGNSRPAWGDNALTRNNVERFGGPGSAGQGRWEYRSGPGDRERDRNRPRRELDLPESGRSGWVAQEHDGLLGSGGPICPGGLMPSQSRPLDRHHGSGRIGRTGELHYPARAGKILSASSREDSDSINDETFGPEERSNEERSEKERQRRESFEQMRKEQQRHHKERLKSQYQNHGETPQSDSRKVSDKNQEDSSLWDAVQNNEVLPSSSPGTPHSSSSKEDVSKTYNKEVAGTTSILHTPRLLIPPGFSKAVLQKSSSIKESDPESKAFLLNVEDENLHVVKQMDLNGEMGPGLNRSTNIIVAGKEHLSNKEEDNWLHSQPKTSKFTGFFSTGEEPSQQRAPSTSEGSSTMPLPFKSGNMASSSCTTDNHFDPVGNHCEGSGFADMQLLLKSENLGMLLNPAKASSDAGTASKEITPNESGSVASRFCVHGQGYVPSMPIGPSVEDVERVITASGSSAASVSSIKEPWGMDHKSSSSVEDLSFHSDPAALSDKSLFSEVLGLHKPSSKQVSESKNPPVFLTCEDIEQSIISEVVQSSGNEPFVSEMGEVHKDIPQSTFNLSQLLQSGSDKNRTDSTGYQGLVGNDSQIDTDINASRHLMSLLQKGTKTVNQASLLEQSVSLTAEDSVVYPAMLGSVTNCTEERETNSNAADIQTLETLFGKAFVNELRSVGQPVSEKSLQDDLAHGGNEDDFQSFLDVVASSRQSNKRLPVVSSDGKHVRGLQSGRNSFSIDSDFGVEFSKEGDAFNLHRRGALIGKKNQLSSLDTDVHNELWPNTSSHALPRMASGQNYDNVSISRGRSMGKSFSSDLGQPQISTRLAHPGNVLHPSGHEGPFLLSAPMPSQGLHFESIPGPQIFHDNTPKIGRLNEHAQTMGMLPPDGAFHPFQAGLFHQPGHHVQGQFGQHSGGQSSIVRGAYRMPSPFPSEFSGSAQMGFDLNDRVGAPHGSVTGLNAPVVDKRSSGDSSRASQGVPGFSPYQHHVSAIMPERNVAYGNSDVGTGSGGPAGMGLPLDNWFNSDMRWSAQNVPGFNPRPRPPAITPDWKLGYG